MRRIGWRLMCRNAARRPSWLSQSSGSQPQPGLRRGGCRHGFRTGATACPARRAGRPPARVAADADARRGSPAWAGPSAVQGQPAIGAGDGMDADAVQAGERAYRRQHGPGRQRPPLDRPAHGRDHLFHQRRRGVAARAGTRSRIRPPRTTCTVAIFPTIQAPRFGLGRVFQTRRAYPEWAACRWSHALQHRFAGRAANPDGSPHAPSRTALPLRLPVPPASRGPRGQPGPTPRARRLGRRSWRCCRWPPPRPPRPRPRSGR